MVARRATLAALPIAVAMCLVGQGVWAQQAPPAEVARRVVVPGRGTVVVGPRATMVIGYVWEADNTPIPDASLRLRDLLTGRIQATATSDATGEFVFTNIEGGTYVIEFADESGKILAVGQAFSAAPGETVATFLRLGAKLPWFAQLFGQSGIVTQTATAAVTTAAGLGVTAVAPTGRPATAQK